MKKTIYKNSQNDFHFGANAPDGYTESSLEELNKYLENLGDKKLWRCNVCNDLQLSLLPLDLCPTCFVKDAYIEIDLTEFNKLIKLL
jgi:rubrerythrin